VKSALIALIGGIAAVIAIQYLPFYMFLLLACALFLAAVLVRPVAIYRWLMSRREASLADQRPGMNNAEFVSALTQAGADRDVAQWLWDAFEVHYDKRTTPHAEDLLLDDLYLDAEDFRNSISAFLDDFGLPHPDPTAPKMAPQLAGTTLTSFAVYLTQRKYWLTNKKRASA
jgi:hypothetical protein